MLKRLSLLLLCLAAVPAAAADYPSRAIRMVVPFAPGGGTDVLGRIIAQRLQEKWGQPVVVENQPGASGGIGTRAAASTLTTSSLEGSSLFMFITARQIWGRKEAEDEPNLRPSSCDGCVTLAPGLSE